MDDNIKSRFDDLPDIPDYPNSPLPAWKHYGITDFAGRKIQEELNRMKYSGYLIGLRFEYVVGEDQGGTSYFMTFGRVPVDDDTAQTLEGIDPLSDEFMIGLYTAVSTLTRNNIADEFDDTTVQLDVTISGSEINKRYRCRRVQNGECNQGHVGVRMICKRESGKWSCTHQNCPN